MAKDRPRNNPRQPRSGPKAVDPSDDASARGRSFQVLRDMGRNPSLTLTQGARNRNVDSRTVQKHVGAAFQRDSSGRIRVRPTDRLRQTLYIPGAKPGEKIAVPTTNSTERRLLGRWMAALNNAGRGDFSKMDKVPRNQTIGGVRLATSRNEVQRILEALAEKESPFEGLYRTLARPS
jgi:hypothetical protein